MEQTIKLPSKSESLKATEKFIDQVCEQYQVSEDFYGNILIALTEGVNNAIHHGNRSNPNKFFTFSFKYNEGLLSFTIEDEGPGFDYENLPDPTDPQNIAKPHGRGVFLMRNLCDNIEFFEGGAKVILHFDITEDLVDHQNDEVEEND